MDSLKQDVEELNQRVLLFASTSDTNRRCLGVGGSVAARLARATPEGCRTAIQCGVPLVKFRREVLDDVGSQRPLKLAVRARLANPSAELQSINVLSLQLAQRAALLDDALSALWFGLPATVEAALTRTSITDLAYYGERSAMVVELRAASMPMLWGFLMIGERVEGRRGQRISQDAALLSLDAGAMQEQAER